MHRRICVILFDVPLNRIHAALEPAERAFGYHDVYSWLQVFAKRADEDYSGPPSIHLIVLYAPTPGLDSGLRHHSQYLRHADVLDADRPKIPPPVLHTAIPYTSHPGNGTGHLMFARYHMHLVLRTCGMHLELPDDLSAHQRSLARQ